MKAVIVNPNQPNSVAISDVSKPSFTKDQVLIQTLRVGIDGTDREINAGLYGTPPPGFEYLILGHEAVGKIIEIGENVADFNVGDIVVPTVRRPDDCEYCQQGYFDLCIKGEYTERGIKGEHGYMAEFFVENPVFLLKIPADLEELAVILEPLSVVEKGIRESWEMQTGRMPWNPKTAIVLGIGMIGILASLVLQSKGLDVWIYSRDVKDSPKVKFMNSLGIHYVSAQDVDLKDLPQHLGINLDFIFEATGNSTVAITAISIIGLNGILCLTGVTGGATQITICADCLNLEMVLGNKAIVGTVNSNYVDFEQGLNHLIEFKAQYPTLISELIDDRIDITEIVHIVDDIKKPHQLKSIVEFKLV